MLKKYLLDRVSVLIFFLLTNSFAILFLKLVGTPLNILYLLSLIILIVGIIFLSIGFIRYHLKYKKLRDIVEGLDRRYLITEILDRPANSEAAFYYDLLKSANRDMVTELAENRAEYLDYREFIEEWIHEMKTPLTTISMLNTDDVEYQKKLKRQFIKLSDLLDMSLYYIRSNTLEKDYQVQKINLAGLVHQTILKEKDRLLVKNIVLNVDCDEDTFVYADEKWIAFILHQIMLNAIQYVDSLGGISISECEDVDTVRLMIRDNGCGISAADLPRVFEKGFTGRNKKRDKASGIGLYLCKKSADKMGIGLDIKSREGEYTEVTICFPKGRFHREVLD